jgi:hypothetical protein
MSARSRPAFLLVHCLALIPPAGPLLSAVAERPPFLSDREDAAPAPGNRQELTDFASPGPGPSLHKSLEQPLAASLPVARHVGLPCNLRRHSGRAAHALIFTGAIFCSTLHTTGVRLQI